MLFQVSQNKPIHNLVVSSSGKAQLKKSRSSVARHQCDTDAPAVLHTAARQNLPFFQSVKTEVQSRTVREETQVIRITVPTFFLKKTHKSFIETESHIRIPLPEYNSLSCMILEKYKSLLTLCLCPLSVVLNSFLQRKFLYSVSTLLEVVKNT